MPYLSIIIPCYNSESFLPACIECLEKQTCKDFEVIFVDDESTDNTVNVCEEFSFANKKIIGIEHGGPAEARNIGVKEATGKYIWFVDSDDTFENDAVERIIIETQDSDADILRFGYSGIHNKKNINSKSPFDCGVYEGEGLLRIQRYCVGHANEVPFFLWIHVYKKELVQQVKFLSLWEYLSESNSFNQRIYVRANKICVIPDILYHYYVRPGSASFVHRPIADKVMNLYVALKNDYKNIRIFDKYKDVLSYCVLNTLYLGHCLPNRGAFITEYAYCSSIEIAHQRIQKIISSLEFKELLKEAKNVEMNEKEKEAYEILLIEDEEKLFEFIITLQLET